MSVLPSDIVVYGSANMPEADGAINGGAIDFSRRVAFYDGHQAGNLDRNIELIKRHSDQGYSSMVVIRDWRDPGDETLSLTASVNVQPVLDRVPERLLYAALSGATANGPAANPGGVAADCPATALAYGAQAVYCRPVQSPLTQRFEPHRADPPITPGRPRPCSSCRRVTDPASPSDR